MQVRDIQEDIVEALRKIRDEISNEIKDMSFEQERAYLDKLLADKDKTVHEQSIVASGNMR